MKYLCVALATPPNPDNVEAIAEYDVAILPQSPEHAEMRAQIKVINPDCKILAYHQILHEMTGNGPGHEFMNDFRNWLWQPYGDSPYVLRPNGDIGGIVMDGFKPRRLYNYRSISYQSMLPIALDLVRDIPNVDGLFLDNSTVWTQQFNAPEDRQEFVDALQKLILDYRRKNPDLLILGNSAFNWMGLNGEMNENRPQDALELAPFEGQIQPNMNVLVQHISGENDPLIASSKALAEQYDALYGISLPPHNVVPPRSWLQ